MEYESYYYIKFQRYPKITKKHHGESSSSKRYGNIVFHFAKKRKTHVSISYRRREAAISYEWKAKEVIDVFLLVHCSW